MKRFLVSTVVACCVAALVESFIASGKPARASCHLCDQDVAAATYYVFGELDNDGQVDISPNAPVNQGTEDELENVNLGPKVLSVVQRRDGRVVVTLTVYFDVQSDAPDGTTEAVTFSAAGAFIDDRQVTA